MSWNWKRRLRREILKRRRGLRRGLGSALTAAEYAIARRALQAEGRRLVRVLGHYDVVLTPTLGRPPVRVGELKAHGLEGRLQDLVKATDMSSVLRLPGVVERTAAQVYDFIPFTPVANITGQPSMNVPLVWNESSLPIGTMFTARFGDEATLYRLAGQLEQARPWAQRRPPVWSGNP